MAAYLGDFDFRILRVSKKHFENLFENDCVKNWFKKRENLSMFFFCFFNLGVKAKNCPQIPPKICISKPGLLILLLTRQWHGIHTTAITAQSSVRNSCNAAFNPLMVYDN